MHVTRPAAAPQAVDRRAAAVGGFVLAVLVLLGMGLMAAALLARPGDLPASGLGQFAYPSVAAAPALELSDQDGQPFTLDRLAGRPVLVFFGYTHCPDVCPATIGTISQALAGAGPGPRAVFASIDPERDDVAAMKSYLHYLPPAFTGLTGSPEAVRRTADAWHVQYARIDEGSASGYGMAHTADVFLVDAAGRLRAHFPFGTAAEPITAALRVLLAETPPPNEIPSAGGGIGSASGAATPSTEPTSAPASPATPPPATPTATTLATGDLHAVVVSTSIWSGGASPVILTLADAMGMPFEPTLGLRAHLANPDGSPAGPDVAAVAVQPPGDPKVSYVVTLDIPSPGPWTLALTGSNGLSGTVGITAFDPGSTARLGAPAPDVRTPTLADVSGVALAVTTQPQPDLRLSQTSTAAARAAGKPYVLVVDSARFRVSPACGRAITMVRYLLDRWTDEVVFIHLEPFHYAIVTDAPVLAGDITDPPLNEYARAFGLGQGPWSSTDMPWVFVVDGSGIVRAKYTGVVGSADVDVVLSMLAGDVAPAP